MKRRRFHIYVSWDERADSPKLREWINQLLEDKAAEIENQITQVQDLQPRLACWDSPEGTYDG